jgi:hypothetical protein
MDGYEKSAPHQVLEPETSSPQQVAIPRAYYAIPPVIKIVLLIVSILIITQRIKFTNIVLFGLITHWFIFILRWHIPVGVNKYTNVPISQNNIYLSRTRLQVSAIKMMASIRPELKHTKAVNELINPFLCLVFQA